MSTPLEISIAIHYGCGHLRPYAENEPEHRNSIMVRRITQEFLARGWIVPAPEALVAEGYGTEYICTDALKTWVAELCRVPYPIQTWIVPERRKE